MLPIRRPHRLSVLLVLLPWSAGYADHRTVAVSTGTQLRDAISGAQEGDVIELADGSYTPIGPLGQDHFRIVNPGVHFTIRAVNPGSAIIDGGNTQRLMEIRGTNPGQEGWVVLEGLVFANGDTDTVGNSGGVNVVGGRATFVDCTFQNNTATPAQSSGASSGAMTVTAGGFVQIQGCTFDGNTTDNHGGGLLVGQGSEVVIHDSVFTSNRSNVAGHRDFSLGGAIHAFNTAQGTTTRLAVTNTRFEDNEAGFVGGGIMAKGNFAEPGVQAVASPTEVTVTNSTFLNNTADPHPSVTPPSPTEGGGIIAENNVSLVVRTSRFTGNTAGFGGAISSYRGAVDIGESEFRNNDAFGQSSTGTAGRGGAIKVHSSDSCSNTANLPSTSLTIRDSLFEANTGQVGGGLYVAGDVARQYGGSCPLGTLNDNRATLILERVVLSGGIADDLIGNSSFGGGFFAHLVDVDISDSLFIDNDARGVDTTNPSSSSQGRGGGASIIQGSRLTLSGTTFAGNVAHHEGGGLHLSGVAIASFSSNTFTGNSVSPGGGRSQTTSEGAALYIEPDFAEAVEATGVVDGSTFSDNSGLAIYDRDQSGCPSCTRNLVTYTDNLFHETTFSDKVFYNNVEPCPQACDAPGLNSLVVDRGSGDTTDKAPTNDNAENGSSVVTGMLLAAPPAVITPTASGDPDQTTDAFLGFSWNGGCAELDGQNLVATTGTNETTTGLHSLMVFNGGCTGGPDIDETATVSLGPTPWAMLSATPVAIAEGASSTLSWNVSLGTFLSGLITHDANDSLATSSGNVSPSPPATTTFRLFAVTEEGGAVATAIVAVDDPAPGAIFADGFESGNTSAWSASVP